MGSHFQDALTQILDWYPLAEAFGLQRTITTLRDDAFQMTLAFNLSGAVLVCDCPPIVDLYLCMVANWRTLSTATSVAVRAMISFVFARVLYARTRCTALQTALLPGRM